MVTLDSNMFTRLWPHASHSLTDKIVANYAAVFTKFGMTSPSVIADFFAQVSEETSGGAELEENLNYSAKRLCVVWPRRFPTVGDALPYAYNPKALANKVYGGRYGNRPDTDDGYVYRGRGGIQITFRDNYARVGKEVGLDLVGRPDLAALPDTFLDVAAAYWKLANLNDLADKGDFRGETLRINGGLTNYDKRVAWRKIWRNAFKLPA